MERICTTCKEIKDLSQFYLDKRFDIPRSKCIQCCNIYSAKRKKTNPPKLDQEKARARRKRWLDKNPNYKLEYDRKRYPDVKDTLNAKRNEWLNRTGKALEYVNRRRAISNNAKGDYSTLGVDSIVHNVFQALC